MNGIVIGFSVAMPVGAMGVLVIRGAWLWMHVRLCDGTRRR
jgi:hypothetical protein